MACESCWQRVKPFNQVIQTQQDESTNVPLGCFLTILMPIAMIFYIGSAVDDLQASPFIQTTSSGIMAEPVEVEILCEAQNGCWVSPAYRVAAGATRPCFNAYKNGTCIFVPYKRTAVVSMCHSPSISDGLWVLWQSQWMTEEQEAAAAELGAGAIIRRNQTSSSSSRARRLSEAGADAAEEPDAFVPHATAVRHHHEANRRLGAVDFRKGLTPQLAAMQQALDPSPFVQDPKRPKRAATPQEVIDNWLAAEGVAPVGQADLARDLSSFPSDNFTSSSDNSSTSDPMASPGNDTTSQPASDSTGDNSTNPSMDTTGGGSTNPPMDSTGGGSTNPPMDSTGGGSTNPPMDSTGGGSTNPPMDSTGGGGSTFPSGSSSPVFFDDAAWGSQWIADDFRLFDDDAFNAGDPFYSGFGSGGPSSFGSEVGFLVGGQAGWIDDDAVLEANDAQALGSLIEDEKEVEAAQAVGVASESRYVDINLYSTRDVVGVSIRSQIMTLRKENHRDKLVRLLEATPIAGGRHAITHFGTNLQAIDWLSGGEAVDFDLSGYLSLTADKLPRLTEDEINDDYGKVKCIERVMTAINSTMYRKFGDRMADEPSADLSKNVPAYKRRVVGTLTNDGSTWHRAQIVLSGAETRVQFTKRDGTLVLGSVGGFLGLLMTGSASIVSLWLVLSNMCSKKPKKKANVHQQGEAINGENPMAAVGSRSVEVRQHGVV